MPGSFRPALRLYLLSKDDLAGFFILNEFKINLLVGGHVQNERRSHSLAAHRAFRGDI